MKKIVLFSVFLLIGLAVGGGLGFGIPYAINSSKQRKEDEREKSGVVLAHRINPRQEYIRLFDAKAGKTGDQIGRDRLFVNIANDVKNEERIEEIRRFIERTHTTDQMVFSSIGNFSAKSAQAVAERYLSDFQPTKREYQRIVPAVYEAFDKRISRHTHQSHGIIGTRGYGITDERRLPLALLVNILGGPSANSLLNLLLREKYGLSYNVEASYTPYSDSGIVGIYFSSDHANTEQCIELIEEEIARLRGELITPRRLQVAKRQFVAQMAISMESNEGYMLGAGKSFLLYKDIDTLEEAYKKVMAITAEQIMEVAKDSFANLSRLIYK